MASHSPLRAADLHEQVMHECAVMARFALASGMKVSPSLLGEMERIRQVASPGPAEMAALARVHSQLVVLVAPATPRALLALGDEGHDLKRLAWLGHAGVVRRMMLVAAISVLLFLAVNVSDVVNDGTADLLKATGPTAIALEVWFVSAAAMGASFAMLMQVSDYIVKRTYDPKHEPGYWIRFLLGIMAGLILAVLVPVPKDSAIAALGKPTLALLGGFSASAVYRILIKLVETVEALFRPSPRDEIAQRERAAQVRANEESNQGKVTLAGRLVRLQQQISSGAAAGDITGELQKILNTLVPETGAAEADAAPAGTVAVGNLPIVGAKDAAGAGTASPTASSGDGDADVEGEPVAAAAGSTSGYGDSPSPESTDPPAAG
ncbi:MAG TPA: hypothetical protein VF092_03145 [Longimicrobium sp.]